MMNMLSIVLTSLVCFLHFYFMFLEMVLWEKKSVRAVFGMSAEIAKQTRPMAINQGLYNGFLAAGLLWSLLVMDDNLKMQLQVYFLSCVLIAGVVGALTVTRRILWIQSFPAALALLVLFLK